MAEKKCANCMWYKRNTEWGTFRLTDSGKCSLHNSKVRYDQVCPDYRQK